MIEGNEIDMTGDPFDSAGIFIGSGTGWIVQGNTVRNSTNPTGAIEVLDLVGRQDLASAAPPDTVDAVEASTTANTDSIASSSIIGMASKTMARCRLPFV